MTTTSTTLREQVQAIAARCEQTHARIIAAFEVRQSIELSTARSKIEEVKRLSTGWLAYLDEVPKGNGYVHNGIAQMTLKLAEFKMPFALGVPHDSKSATHYCVTADSEHGYGVLSAHDNKEDARYNATLSGGKCAALDRNEDGRIIAPHALREALTKAAEYC